MTSGLIRSCGRTEPGVGWCWGYNEFGDLGDGTFEDRFSPVRIAAPQ
jgi:alpha-tubulin suppressor-like RCC1 family protein